MTSLVLNNWALVCASGLYFTHYIQFEGRSRSGKQRRQSYPQRRSSRVEDIAEDSEEDDVTGVPQKSDGRYYHIYLNI